MKIKLTEPKTIGKVLAMVKEKRMLIKTITQRQKNLVGHVLRSDSLRRTVWEGNEKEGKNEVTGLDDTVDPQQIQRPEQIGVGQKKMKNVDPRTSLRTKPPKKMNILIEAGSVCS